MRYVAVILIALIVLCFILLELISRFGLTTILQWVVATVLAAVYILCLTGTP